MDNKIKKVALKMLQLKKFQSLYEKSTDKEALKHGHPTKEFEKFVITSATKYIEKKNIKQEKQKEIEIIPESFSIPDISVDSKIQTKSLIKVPEVFKSTFDEVWTPTIKKEMDTYLQGKKRKKGFLMYFDGGAKTGKTHFAQSAVEFKGYKSKYRDIPSGRPVFIIEADNANIDETETKWHKYLPSEKHPEGLIHIQMCYIEDKETKIIDPEKTLYNIYAALFSLSQIEEGTIVLDPFPLFCDLILFVYMLKHTSEGKFDISFDEFLKPERKITIFEYQYKKKLIYEVLRKLRNYKVNIILIGNVKPEYSTGKNMYDSKKTGRFLTDSGQTGSDYWVDVIGRFFKKTEEIQMKKGGNVTTKNITRRYLAITDCRFEEEEFLNDSVIFKAPKFIDIMKYLMRVYPK